MPHSGSISKSQLVRVVATTLVSGGIFLAVVFAASRFLESHASDPTIRWLAALTGFALAAVVVVAMRNLERMDELERTMHSEAMAFAFLCSVLLVAAYSFAQAAGLAIPEAHWLLPSMMMCWVMGLLKAVRRYR